jgi:hypothetical protein
MDEIISRTSKRTGIDEDTIRKVVRLFFANLERAIYYERNINLLRMMIMFNMKTSSYGGSPQIIKEKKRRNKYYGIKGY